MAKEHIIDVTPPSADVDPQYTALMFQGNGYTDFEVMDRQNRFANDKRRIDASIADMADDDRLVFKSADSTLATVLAKDAKAVLEQPWGSAGIDQFVAALMHNPKAPPPDFTSFADQIIAQKTELHKDDILDPSELPENRRTR